MFFVLNLFESLLFVNAELYIDILKVQADILCLAIVSAANKPNTQQSSNIIP